MIKSNVIIPDISFYQDDNTTPNKVDFVKMKAAGAAGVIVRAGQRSYVDEDFKDFWAGAKAAGLPRGVYWFYDSRSEPIAQARQFASLIEHDLPEMEVWGDFEETYHGRWAGWRSFAVFMAEVERLLPTCKLGVYTNYYYWRDNAPNILVNWPSLQWFKRYALWIAGYTANPASVRIPTPWSSALLWQYTGNGPGRFYGAESAGIDLSYWQGTPEAFAEKYKVGASPAPIPIPPAKPPTLPRLYRILGDQELPAGSRPTGKSGGIRDGLPSTVRLQGGKGSVNIPPAWMKYIYDIQGNPNYQFSTPTTLGDMVGWHNSGAGNKVEEVVFSGNVLEVQRIEGTRAYIKTVSTSDLPPRNLVKPVGGQHPLIHNFSIQYKSYYDLSTDGKFARTIVFCNPGESLWIDLAELVPV